MFSFVKAYLYTEQLMSQQVSELDKIQADLNSGNETDLRRGLARLEHFIAVAHIIESAFKLNKANRPTLIDHVLTRIPDDNARAEARVRLAIDQMRCPNGCCGLSITSPDKAVCSICGFILQNESSTPWPPPYTEVWGQDHNPYENE